MDDAVAAADLPARSHHHEHTNVKETIESILVAFILAFIFRAFVVEAFVIPTGSMAPTLLGAHMRFRCDDCGYEFDTNYQSPDADGDEVSIPANSRLSRPMMDPKTGRNTLDKTFRIHCPNCMYRIPRSNPADPTNVATNPPVFYGDRILVMKYLYLLFPPQRWDVVVFKSPAEPDRHHYSQNYIKRLIGRPGESVMILDGDIYVSTKGRESKLEDFVVQTKPRWAQEALWRVVFDNDYQPRGKQRALTDAANRPVSPDPPFAQPWIPADGDKSWDLSQKRILKFNNRESAGTLAFNSEANEMPGAGFAPALTDWLVYDITLNQHANGMPQRPAPPDISDLGGYVADNNVSDVKLVMYYKRLGGDGPLKLNLTVRPGTDVERTFVAEIGRTQAKLIMRDRKGIETEIGNARMPADCSDSTKIELIQADYQVTLRVDSRDLLQSTPQQFSPDLPYLLNAFTTHERLPKPKISITAEKQQAELTHLGLWRDVYFTNRERGTGENITIRNRPQALPWGWATPENFPRKIIHLGADEYFACGDNSLISGDGRYWSSPIDLPHENLRADSGRVPGRFLLGKAFFVYWPAGYKPILGDAVPAIVPNFGRMRFIH